MNIYWVVAATLIAVVAVLAAVIFGLRGGGDGGKPPQASEQTLRQSRKEPVFTATTPPPPEAQPEEKTAQGQLGIEKFDAPQLPPPPDDMLAADMCYAVYVFAQTPINPQTFAPLLESWHKWRLPRCLVLGYDESDKQWRKPQNGGGENKKNWLLAVPLADRGGALDDARIRKLEESARRFCQSIDAHGKFPPAAEAAKNAKLLDVFCNSVDKIVEIHLAGSPSLARTAEAAQVCGLAAIDGGLKYAFRQNSETLFSMTVAVRMKNEVRRVVFDLDAPNVSNPAQAFDAMVNALKRTASMLSLDITDKNGEAVDAERIDQMRGQIAVLSAEMKKFGVPPGGAVARLLFA
ncbi:MAG: cell division protein ZipA C-terminal FtsZ-binding domain-containing protein [Gammaproteobacteria bacterium]